MKLIDADALNFYLVCLDNSDQWESGITKADIDAAPTICCERCGHFVGDCEVPICDHERGLDYPDQDEACSHFTPREEPA